MDPIYLRQWRMYAGITQTELGDRMGITGTQISRIESGKRDFDGRFLMLFKQAINAKLDTYPPEGRRPWMRINHMADPLLMFPDENLWVAWGSVLQSLPRPVPAAPPAPFDRTG